MVDVNFHTIVIILHAFIWWNNIIFVYYRYLPDPLYTLPIIYKLIIFVIVLWVRRRLYFAIHQWIQRWLRNSGLGVQSLEVCGHWKLVVPINAQIAWWCCSLWVECFWHQDSLKFAASWWIMASQCDQLLAHFFTFFGQILHQWRLVLIASLYCFFGRP